MQVRQTTDTHRTPNQYFCTGLNTTDVRYIFRLRPLYSIVLTIRNMKQIFCRLITKDEALPGVLGYRGNRAFISGEQGNKGQILRGTGEQRQYWGTGNIRKQIFDFWGTGEQANLFQGNKGKETPLGGPQRCNSPGLEPKDVHVR